MGTHYLRASLWLSYQAGGAQHLPNDEAWPVYMFTIASRSDAAVHPPAECPKRIRVQRLP